MTMQQHIVYLAVRCMLLCGVSLLIGCTSTQNIDNSEQRHKIAKKNLQLAAQYLSVRQPLQAITRLKKAIELRSDYADAYGLLAVVYQQQQEYSLAQRNFKKALNLASNNSIIRNNYGTLLYVEKRYSEAKHQFQLVSQDSYYENRDRVFENLGATYLKLGDIPQAIANYQRALRLNARLPSAHLKLAQILQKQGDDQQAFKHYEQFASMAVQSASSLFFGYQLAKRLGQKKTANYCGQKLMQRFPSSPEYKQYKVLTSRA